MKIRKATKKDYKKIAEIYKSEFNRKPYNEKWTDKTALKSIKEPKTGEEIYVAVLDDKIVGFIITFLELWDNGYHGIIEDLAVKHQFKGQGIGKALIKKIEENYKKRRIPTIHLMTSRKAFAYKFYKKLKYKESKDMVIFRKNIK